MRPAVVILAGLVLLSQPAPIGTLAMYGQDRPERQSGLPAGLKDLPLSGGAGQTSRQREPGAVSFLSPAEASIAPYRAVPIDLRFRIAGGMHINSHTPRDKALIATRLAIMEGGGLEVIRVDFPPGERYVPAFAPKETLSVYSGDLSLRAQLKARPGKHTLHGALRYQACDLNSCMPPRSLPFAVAITAR